MEAQSALESRSVSDQPGARKATNALRFSRHLVEMLVVMMLGMCVLGAAFQELHLLAFGSGFVAAWRDHVELAAFAMAVNMTVPMVLWMRYRGHTWERGGEMAATMNAPLLPVLVVYWLGVIPSGPVLGLQMLLMLPAMLVLMLRRRSEYSAPHHGNGHLRRRLRRIADAR